jgi:SAM-dependent methyltransferase
MIVGAPDNETPLRRFAGWGIKTRLLNPYDAYWDWRLGVQTFGHHPASGSQGDSNWRLHYTPTPYSDIFQLLEMANLTEGDVFVDLGSGLGRAVFAASLMGARRSIGIEVVPDLCAKAVDNFKHSSLRGMNIEFICDDALNYRHHETSILFMFHPFGENTMRRVLHDINEARRERPAPELRIIYMNPVFDFVLEQTGWLERFKTMPPPHRSFSTSRSYVTSLWRSLR